MVCSFMNKRRDKRSIKDLRDKCEMFRDGKKISATTATNAIVRTLSNIEKPQHASAEVYFLRFPKIYQPSTHANTKGATMVASLSIMYLGVFISSLPQVIFSLGCAPEYDP